MFIGNGFIHPNTTFVVWNYTPSQLDVMGGAGRRNASKLKFTICRSNFFKVFAAFNEVKVLLQP